MNGEKIMTKAEQNLASIERQLNYQQRQQVDRLYALSAMGPNVRFIYGNKFGETFWLDDQGRLFQVAWWNIGRQIDPITGRIPCERKAKFIKMERAYLERTVRDSEPVEAA
jgi:hypothetical protein